MKLLRSSNRFLPMMVVPTLAALALVDPPETQAQGCVAIRSVGNPALPGLAGMDHADPWLISLSYRYFQADRYFMGTDELSGMPGMAPGQQVINEIQTFDLALSYAVSSRLSLTLDLPVVAASRTSREEHMGMMDFSEPQRTTRASGIGDLRLTADYWLRNPSQHPDGNIAVGLGVKMPTGTDDKRDNFFTPDGVVNRPVDPSIQPGDGGWGVIFQFQGYQSLVGHLSLYANGMYLMNPREVNGVRSFTMKPLDESGEAYNQDHVNSVADQFLARLGLNYVVLPEAGLSISFGGRIEGIPMRDLAGGDGGFRRPGYVVSVEPGLNWVYGPHLLAMTAPVAVHRNRQRSVTERAFANNPNEMLRIYPASFADWNLFVSYSYRF